MWLHHCQFWFLQERRMWLPPYSSPTGEKNVAIPLRLPYWCATPPMGKIATSDSPPPPPSRKLCFGSVRACASST